MTSFDSEGLPAHNRNKRFRKVGERLAKLVGDVSALPYASVQYTLSEVGPPNQRLDPVELRWILSQLTTAKAADASIIALQPLPDIYVSSTLTKADRDQHARVVAMGKEDHLRKFAQHHSGNRALAIADVICRIVPNAGDVELLDSVAIERLGGSAYWRSDGARLHLQKNDRTAVDAVWITCNLGWILPHDAGLWRHLLHCADTGSRAIIIARKIAFSTFPLLKRIGALGLQTHELTLAEDRIDHQFVSRAMPKGPLVGTVEALAEQALIKEVLPFHLSDASERSHVNQAAVEHGLASGLGNAGGGTADALKAWASSAPLAMPRPWKGQITRYVQWQSDM